MAGRTRRLEEKAAVLVSVAREIIRETGDFDLPMRQLAARAQVSLRTPYELFGSKNGVIRAILKLDQAGFRTQVRTLASADWIDNIFDRVKLGVELYAGSQPFYRALFRATQGYSGGDETEPARENLRTFRVLAHRAQNQGLIHPEIDTDILGEALTDVFASNVRTWASSSFDIALVEHKIGFGFACLLAGVVPDPVVERMRRRALAYQAAIQQFAEPAADAPQEPAG
jgi:AcrR family transcriptional regulator